MGALQSCVVFLYLRGANSPRCVTTLCFAFSFVFLGWTFTTPLFFHVLLIPRLTPRLCSTDEALATFRTDIHIHSETSRWMSCWLQFQSCPRNAELPWIAYVSVPTRQAATPQETAPNFSTDATPRSWG